MRENAVGPDSWAAGAFAPPLRIWLHGLTDLWNRCPRDTALPERWLERRTAFTDKLDGLTRSLAIASTLGGAAKVP